MTDHLPMPEAVISDLVILDKLDWRSAAAFLSTSRGHAALARGEPVFRQRHGAARAIQRAWLRRGHRRARRLHGCKIALQYGPPGLGVVTGVGVARGTAVAPAPGHRWHGRGIGIAPRATRAGARLGWWEGRPGQRVAYWQELSTEAWPQSLDYLSTLFADFCPWHRVRDIVRLRGPIDVGASE
ncbi:MAG: hypothetical protein VYE81_07495 [Planctomycetota bacterium]|nr:hypothetical protein [Planctomycetota bacterium]